MTSPIKIGEETVDGSWFYFRGVAELSNGGFATAEYSMVSTVSYLSVRYTSANGEDTNSVTLVSQPWVHDGSTVDYVIFMPVIAGLSDGGAIISATIRHQYFSEGLQNDDPDPSSSTDSNYSAILNEDGSVRNYFSVPDDFGIQNISVSDNGQFMLVGQSDFSDTINARIYDGSGVLIDGSISIDAPEDLRPIMPSAAAIDGGYVVAWTNASAVELSGVVSMQLLDRSGEKVGGPIEIASRGSSVSVKALEDERFIVTWSGSDGSDNGIHAQLYSATGETIGDEFIVNTETAEDQGEASVTELADGSYVVVWTDMSGTGGDPSAPGIKGQVFAATGEKRGDEFLVNTQTDGYQQLPHVIALTGERFVVQWNSQDGSIREQIFDASNLPNDFVAPTIEGLSDDTVAENTENRTIFGTVEATDAGSAAGELRFELLDDADGRFTIGAASGAVRVADSLLLDYEQLDSFTIEVRVTDAGGNFADRELTIHLDDVSPETVSGDDRGNLIRAGAGADSLSGAGGADTLEGGGGADTLDGGEDADRLVGGNGNDRYLVDDMGDVVVEASGGGNDEVQTTLSYTLSASFEALTLCGGQDIHGTGNGLANRITGNSGDNTLAGKGGADRLDGGRGADKLDGGLGADRLDGGLGADVLIGRGGADIFRFNTAIDGGDNVDAIKGFSAAKDTIELAKSVFPALSLGALDDDAFVVGARAADDEDRIIYKSSTGALLYDRDGAGGADAIRFATLGRGLDIDADDFRVI